jgi:hypothetical protein
MVAMASLRTHGLRANAHVADAHAALRGSSGRQLGGIRPHLAEIENAL